MFRSALSLAEATRALNTYPGYGRWVMTADETVHGRVKRGHVEVGARRDVADWRIRDFTGRLEVDPCTGAVVLVGQLGYGRTTRWILFPGALAFALAVVVVTLVRLATERSVWVPFPFPLLDIFVSYFVAMFVVRRLGWAGVVTQREQEIVDWIQAQLRSTTDQ